MQDKEYKWEKPNVPPDIICDGDVRIVHLPVKVLFEYSTDIPTDFDEEGNVLDTREGYLMKVLPNQVGLFKDEKTLLLDNTTKDI